VGLTKKITNKSNIIFKEFKDIPESKIIPMDKKKTPSVSIILQACILKKKIWHTDYSNCTCYYKN
jgi:hypothetical protein